jgi:hypothetical protein
MANANDILTYLPTSFKTRDEQDYINFLWDSYEVNYKNDKFQFAFMAFHLVFMTYAYFQIWKIYNGNVDDFKKSCLGFDKLDTLIAELEERNIKNIADSKPLEILYPFSFSEINERTIMIFFKLIGCDKSKIGKYKKIVDERNEIAHANGKLIFVAVENLDKKINEIMLLVEEIQKHSASILNACFKQFLIDSSVPDEREFYDPVDQIREILINSNYLSQKDIEQLLGFRIETLNAEPNFGEMSILFASLTNTYATVD